MAPVCLCIGIVKFALTSYLPFRFSRAQSNVDGFAMFCIIHSFYNVLCVRIRGKKGGNCFSMNMLPEKDNFGIWNVV